MIGYQGNFIEQPGPSDTVATSLMTAGTGQAYDWPAGSQIIRLSGVTTAGAPFGFGVNLRSTAAHWSAAASSFTTGSTGTFIVPPGESRVFQVPSNSTGFSIMAGSSGIVGMELWKKGG